MLRSIFPIIAKVITREPDSTGQVIMTSLEFSGHNYFGQWFSKYSPEIHDVIMGPVEDFTPLDYPEVKTGESFVKIGVGTVYKQDDKPYHFARLYQLLNGGKWTVKKSPRQSIVYS